MIDIDGTICNISTDGNYSKSKPMLNNIAYFNELFDKGHEIHYLDRQRSGFKQTLGRIHIFAITKMVRKIHDIKYGKTTLRRMD